MKDKIKEYIDFVIKNPLENIYDIAVKYFGQNPLPEGRQFLVAPELSQIFITKRAVVKSIIREKTGYEVDINDFLIDLLKKETNI